MALLPSVACVLAVFLLAWGLNYPLLRPGVVPRALALLLGLGVFAAPLLLPPGALIARLVLAVAALALVTKGIDIHAESASGTAPGLRRYWIWGLYPPLHFVHRKLGSEPGLGRRGEALRLLRGAIEMAAGAVLLERAVALDLGRTSFALEHVVKLLAFYPVLDGAVHVLIGAWRLAGGSAVDVLRDPIVSRTPAEFWRRYNRVYGEWLGFYVYETLSACSSRGTGRGLPSPGRARVPRGVACIATFLYSGLVHEYLFWVPLQEVQGFQLAFFLLHGVAVALTAQVRPAGAAALAWWAGTVAFTLATLVLFAASVTQVLPLYPRGHLLL